MIPNNIIIIFYNNQKISENNFNNIDKNVKFCLLEQKNH